jgi:hypothetical protein
MSSDEEVVEFIEENRNNIFQVDQKIETNELHGLNQNDANK